MADPNFSVLAIPGVPMVQKGDPLAEIIIESIRKSDIQLINGDLICIAQKIVSKAEGRLISLKTVEPSKEALELAGETEKDPRLVQLILNESSEVIRKKAGIMIMRHRLGLVGAHAGIDQSNIDHEMQENALLLPIDPDQSASDLKSVIDKTENVNIGVIITDSNNRPWRLGTVGTAIGAAGVEVLTDHRGGFDLYGRELKVTLINRADALAGAATLAMGETTERTPLVIIRGLVAADSAHTASMINRPIEEDLFR
tara:strand:- start:1480 stop:2247 length:768 start_codon:yes stop_codon:yes gene_type:complete